MPDEEYPFLLSTGRVLQHYNVTTPYCSGIQSPWPEEYAEVNPRDAVVLGVETGHRIRVSFRRGRFAHRKPRSVTKRCY